LSVAPIGAINLGKMTDVMQGLVCEAKKNKFSALSNELSDDGECCEN